ncbi:MAG: hypothetical protein C3F11_07100 [Methylocystaceae bacterium]|nr:MAG: hypothetical protein C3F11_07100 [Methylocystaceae bacterium]
MIGEAGNDMANERRKEFGRRGAQAPPVVTHAPGGLPGGSSGPSERRKRSLTIALVSVGALSIGGFALMEAIDRRVKCRQNTGDWEQNDCAESGSRSSSSSHGGSSGSSSHGSSSSQSSSFSAHSVSFGGFGATGAAHGGGGS